MGKEPSGNPFNSLVQPEYEKGIPRNPFINAGAPGGYRRTAQPYTRCRQWCAGLCTEN
ncbi:MAG: glutaminase [Lewinellaceae bacterium]|nr:glutaminase [Lewinellaceae bacterium]